MKKVTRILALALSVVMCLSLVVGCGKKDGGNSGAKDTLVVGYSPFSSKVFTRDNLLDSLWGYDYYGDSRTVDSHIKRLRAKLDSVPHPDWTIKTIWGVGYKLEIAGGQ